MSQALLSCVSENSEVKARMAEERRPGDGFGHRFGFAAFKKMRRLNNAAQEDIVVPPQVKKRTEAICKTDTWSYLLTGGLFQRVSIYADLH